MSLLSELLTTDDLARLLRKSVHSIRHDLSRNPRSLPPRCALPGTNRNLWRPQDVAAWLAAHVLPLESDIRPSQAKAKSTPGARKLGAPTKVERIRRQQAARCAAASEKAPA